jgi:hypothetical protein
MLKRKTRNDTAAERKELALAERRKAPRYLTFLANPVLLDRILPFLGEKKDWLPLVSCTGAVWSVFSRNRGRLQKYIGTKQHFCTEIRSLRAAHPGLMRLSLCHGRLTKETLQEKDVPIGKWPSVVSLILRWECRTFDSEISAFFSGVFPNLRTLDVRVAGAKEIKVGSEDHFPNLENLEIHGTFERLVVHRPLEKLCLPWDEDYTVQCSFPEEAGRIRVLEMYSAHELAENLSPRILWWGPKPACLSCEWAHLFFVLYALDDMTFASRDKPLVSLRVCIPASKDWRSSLYARRALSLLIVDDRNVLGEDGDSFKNIASSLVLRYESEEDFGKYEKVAEEREDLDYSSGIFDGGVLHTFVPFSGYALPSAWIQCGDNLSTMRRAFVGEGTFVEIPGVEGAFRKYTVTVTEERLRGPF